MLPAEYRLSGENAHSNCQCIAREPSELADRMAEHRYKDIQRVTERRCLNSMLNKANQGRVFTVYVRGALYSYFIVIKRLMSLVG